jgi:hypothetical protein
MELESRIAAFIELRLEKREAARMQRWEEAAEIREAERNMARDAYEMANEKCETGYDWKKYESWIKEYCLRQYGTDSLDNSILREIKIGRLGI